MKGTFVLLGLLLMSASGFLLGMQTSQDERKGDFFKLRGQAQSEGESQRPSGVAESSWVQLGRSCGVILSFKEATRADDVFLAGQLTCKFNDEWHPVFLNSPPPSITRSE